MRIQHNIASMNAYRNYNNNTRALSKNLEKLSSGYKINRAGDDAAGLAISEKMRAQITGLNAAQKNVKDGVSLVKTAEGAMQEIQDMLNRMDYLATQSANGTYDNEVDRANLQKEVDNLKTEINRIADSANFNGIKLLDGSLDETIKAQDAVTETVTVDPTKENALTFESGKLADVGQVLGTNTVLHNEANGDNGTEFSVDFHNFKFNGGKGNSMTMKMGDSTITLTATEDHGNVEGADLVNAFLGANGYEISVDGKKVDTLDGMQIKGQTFNVAKGDHDYRLTFTQKTAPASKADEINGSMEVNISGQVQAKKAEYSFNSTDLGTTTVGGVVTINGNSYTIKNTAAAGATPVAQTWDQVIADMNKEGVVEGYKLSIDNGKITMTATEAGEKTTPTVSYKGTKAATVTAGGTPDAGVTGAAASWTLGTALTTGQSIEIGGQTLTFNTAHADFDIEEGGKKYTVSFDETTNKATITAKENGVDTTAITYKAADGTDAMATLAGGADEKKQSHVYDVTGWTDSGLGDFTATVNGKAIAVNYDKLNAAGERGVAVLDEDGNDTGYRAVLDGNTLTFTAKVAGLPATANDPTAGEAPKAAVAGGAFQIYDTANSAKLTADQIEVEQEGATGGAMQGITEGVHGDFNVSTTAIQNVTAGGSDRLASTFFDLTEDMVADGATIKIGTEEYTFSTDEKQINDATANYVDARGDLATIAKALTEKAKGNQVWTVGHDGSRITLTETVEHGGLADNLDYNQGAKFEFDLSTKEGIEKSLGFVGAGSYTKENVVSEATEGGKALTLQIGDTSDDYNQMKVSVGDMHVSAMKTTNEETGESTSIADIDISTQDGAAKAVDVIKNAINYVSSVRGDLGAIQNRLEHTQNNLSVMAENIQDAESTIRDTDVAEEMMSYVKNNILVQSAQAMLAQANQLPQGVLQLLG